MLLVAIMDHEGFVLRENGFADIDICNVQVRVSRRTKYKICLISELNVRVYLKLIIEFSVLLVNCNAEYIGVIMQERASYFSSKTIRYCSFVLDLKLLDGII